MIIKYYKRLIKVDGFILSKIFTSHKKIQLYFSLKNNSKRLISNLNNIYYLLNNLYNLVNLAYLNDSDIYYNNKNKILYYYKTKKVLA